MRLNDNNFRDHPVLASIWRRQDGRCYWCGCDLTLNRGKPGSKGWQAEERLKDVRDWTVDHFLPRALVPTADPYYLVLACTLCNSAKGARLPNLLAIVSFAAMQEAP